MQKVKNIKFTKNTDIIFSKLDEVKIIYNIKTYVGVIEHLCDISINNNKNFKG